MNSIRILRHNKVEPYIVFDGGPLPAKKGTESDRKKRREENMKLGDQLASVGRHKEARDYYVKCVDVTPQMAYQLIKVRSDTLRRSASHSHFSRVLGVEGRICLLRRCAL